MNQPPDNDAANHHVLTTIVSGFFVSIAIMVSRLVGTALAGDRRARPDRTSFMCTRHSLVGQKLNHPRTARAKMLKLALCGASSGRVRHFHELLRTTPNTRSRPSHSAGQRDGKRHRAARFVFRVRFGTEANRHTDKDAVGSGYASKDGAFYKGQGERATRVWRFGRVDFLS